MLIPLLSGRLLVGLEPCGTGRNAAVVRWQQNHVPAAQLPKHLAVRAIEVPVDVAYKGR